jgi:pyruvate/2-oxoglutarate dehydrogenase complex dihydrolipoamide dehydrogenase (E3) component
MHRFRSERECDLLVIGGGTAGLVSAKTAASLGASVALVEQDRPGGDCLWTGCVPSKALIAAASAVRGMEQASSPGPAIAFATADFTAVMAHVRAAIRTIEPVDSFDALGKAGVRTIRGKAVFIADRTVRIDGSEMRFRQAIIATGAPQNCRISRALPMQVR